MYRNTVLLVLGLLLAQAAPVAAQTLIDTTPTWDGAYTIGSLCQTGAFGQTFTVDAPTTVESFSFFLKTTPSYDPECQETFPGECPPPFEPVAFRAQLLAWDPIAFAAVGPVLYESADVYATTDALTEFELGTAGLSLSPGTYVALVNGGGLGDLTGPAADIGIAPWYIGDPSNGGAWVDAYPGGEWVFSQCTDQTDPAAYPWSEQGVEMDTAFILTGTTEPLCPELTDGNANGIPDVVDAQCPCTLSTRDYRACVADEMAVLVADECATSDDLRRAVRAAKQGRCE
jgi:hypothetical protein